MRKQFYSIRVGIALITALTLGACQTVKIPKIDIMKSPEFSEDASKIGRAYPKVKDAPSVPDDIRSDRLWDKDARQLQGLRGNRKRVELEPGPSKAEGKAEFNELKAKAQAYKKDDPPAGPVKGFPKYKPRR